MVAPPKKILPVRVFSSGNELALAVADRVSAVAEELQSSGRPMVLGLAAGASPRGAYRALSLRVRGGQLDLTRCLAFCLDEYYPISPENPRSYAKQMSLLARELGIAKGRLKIPKGDIPREQIESHCRQYEEEIRSAGGIDFQILGVGRSGHIGFNEPGAPRDSRARLIELDERTRQDAAAAFGELNDVPKEALTVGIETIMEAKEIALIALGAHKAAIVRHLVEEPPSPSVPASFLQDHDRAVAYVDREAAKFLLRCEDME